MCELCSKGRIINHPITGDYCTNCGLIIETVNDPYGKKRKRRLRIKESKKNKVKEKVCFGCGTKNNLTMHHIKPIRAGGKGNKENIMLLCRKPCHDIADKICEAYYRLIKR